MNETLSISELKGMGRVIVRKKYSKKGWQAR
jgi:hypothetical protein